MQNLVRVVASSALLVSSLDDKAAKELQEALRAVGFNSLVADGKPGPQTQVAWAAFKQRLNQSDPHIIGPGSLDLLAREVDKKEGKTSEATEAFKNYVPPKEPPAIQASGKTSKMLPSGGAVFVEDAIIPGGKISWAEMTKSGSRWPGTEYIERNIKAIAQDLEYVRVWVGNRPLIVTSGYRDPWSNKAVGGARLSRHMNGDAVDFYVPGMTTAQLYAAVNARWGTRGGIAPSYRGNFLHLDRRGYYATWVY